MSTTVDNSDVPPCAQTMHCLCAFHARGGSAQSPCNTNEAATAKLDPGWGVRPPDDSGAAAAWGARAIYSLPHSEPKRPRKGKGSRAKPEASIDLVWDRMGKAGDEGKVKLLCKWLDTTGLKKLRQTCAAECITPDCEETVTITDGPFTLVASPRMSHGYLYIGAWMVVS